MGETSKKTLFKFISETEYFNLLVSKNFQSIVRMKVFNGENETDKDRTVIISIECTNKRKIKDCMQEIRSFHFPWAKSFQSETTVNDIRAI